MRQNYLLLKAFTFALLLCSFQTFAQLNGTVTICSTLATSGTNYQTFTAFATALNSQGVSGPLVVNVVAGTGPYLEQVTFNQAGGISATNSVTINGNNCTISFAASAAATPWTILLSGADYMTFNNLNVVGTGATYALACHLWNGANFNTFNNCTFTSPMTGTGTGLSPFSVSGTSISATASGNSGNNTTVNTCTMSGGYYSTVFAGATSAPFNVNNRVLNSQVRDFYSYGIYNLYCQNTIAKGNVVERVNRTTITTCYAIYLSTSSYNCLVEGNHVRRLAHGNLTSTSVLYCIYLTADGANGFENVVRNNVVSDIQSNGTQYGIYMSGALYAHTHHNTVILDDPNSTAGTTYGIYCTGGNSEVRNNVVYINRAGTGTKYCLYMTTAATPLICDYNVLNMLSTAGTNGIGYYSAAYPTMANWQFNTGLDLNSVTTDPQFANPSNMDYAPTNMAINNMCPPLGVPTDFLNSPRSPLFPDPGAYEMYNSPCTTTPGANSFFTPTIALCPGASLNFSLLSSNLYTNSGLGIQWQTSTTSVVGPFTAVAGATLNTYTTSPINQTTYFNAIISCTALTASLTTAVGQVSVASTVTNNVPYYEGFETLALNELPNCNWSASNMGGATNTYTNASSNFRFPRNGNNFAAFSNNPGQSYFYSNGIYMKPGITYSASLWFVSEIAGYTNWPDLSILVGSSQNPNGLSLIASTGGSITPSNYVPLGNTFTVSTPGLYYLAVRATSGSGSAPYLSWDDLSVIIPCELNVLPLQVSASTSTLCSGQTAILSAVGANSYSWSTGNITSTVAVAPTTNTTYVVQGTSSLTGCTATMIQNIQVNTSPQVFVTASSPQLCSGSSMTLTGVGATSYYWNTGAYAPSIVVSPSSNTAYQVLGTNGAGCSGTASFAVVIQQPPTMLAMPSSTFLCSGESLTLTATGTASSYKWLTAPNVTQNGNPLIIKPNGSMTYTLIGADNAGCEATAKLTVGVSECTGLQGNATAALRVYPNPATGKFTVEGDRLENATLIVTDVTGRTVHTTRMSEDKTDIDLSNLADGVYNLRIAGANDIQHVRIIKAGN